MTNFNKISYIIIKCINLNTYYLCDEELFLFFNNILIILHITEISRFK